MKSFENNILIEPIEDTSCTDDTFIVDDPDSPFARGLVIDASWNDKIIDKICYYRKDKAEPIGDIGYLVVDADDVVAYDE